MCTKVNVFKVPVILYSKVVFLKCAQAYVGGLYRDQGLEVIKNWIIPIVQPHVEAAYQNLRDDYLPEAILLRVSTASYPSPPPSSASSEGAEPASPSRPARDPDTHRSPRPRVNIPLQGSGRVGGGVENHLEIDQSRSNQRRRRSGQGYGISGDSGKR